LRISVRSGDIKEILVFLTDLFVTFNDPLKDWKSSLSGECLTSKCEALSSISSIAKRKKERKKEMTHSFLGQCTVNFLGSSMLDSLGHTMIT
jgi:hypothetical protein